MSDSPISLQGYIRFMFIALGGFGINLIILWLVILFLVISHFSDQVLNSLGYAGNS
jgi:hypothetical protein